MIQPNKNNGGGKNFTSSLRRLKPRNKKNRFFVAEFSLSVLKSRSFAPLRMTSEGLRMTSEGLLRMTSV